MPFVDIDQRSPEWLHMRCACVTTSHLSDICCKQKNGKYLASRLNYMKKKVWEQLTGLAAENYVSPYMDKGSDVEPLAVTAYEMKYDVEVLNGGLYVHDSIPRFMASPDGRVGEDGLLEIKYLTGFTRDTNHADLLAGDEIPEEFQLQMLGQLSCSGREWVDFCAYCPELAPDLRMVVRRFPRDEKRIAALETEVQEFLLEMTQRVLRIKPGGNLEPILQASVEACK